MQAENMTLLVQRLVILLFTAVAVVRAFVLVPESQFSCSNAKRVR
jgi:hypothetical protein